MYISLLYIFNFFFLCNYSRVIYQAVSSDDLNYWNVARKCVAAFWDAHARIYHGYEVIGMEHVPATGPTLIVYYHGAIPIDMYYFVARVCLERVSIIPGTKKCSRRISTKC